MAQVCIYTQDSKFTLAPFFSLGEAPLPAKLLWTESEARDATEISEVWKVLSLTKCEVG